MRIRRCASRLLGSEYISPPPDQAPRFEPLLLLPPATPPPPPRPCPSATGSNDGSGDFADKTSSGQPPCELSLSPWDLMVQLDLSDPQEQEEFEDTYLVFLSIGTSCAVPTSLPAASVKEEVAVATVDGVDMLKPRHKVAKKTTSRKTTVVKKRKENKELVPNKKAKESDAGEAPVIWTCRKNDGKRWSCHRLVSQPNSLCEHHSDQKRAYCNNVLSQSKFTAAPPSALPPQPQASKPSTSSKPRRKKPVVDVGEGFYYYAGFGPSRSKRQLASTMQQEFPPPAEQNEVPEDHVTAPTAEQAQADASADHQGMPARGSHPSCDEDMARIAGGDEESSDGELRAPVVINGDSRRKSPLKKRWRKPVKARSLKSLM